MNKKWMYLLLLPGFLLVFVFLAVPLFFSMTPAFFPDGVFSLNLYRIFFTDAFYLQIFWRTIKIALITSCICMLTGVPAAYFISRKKKSIRTVLIACTAFPLLTNSVVRAFAWITILGKNGVINAVLRGLGAKEPLQMLYTESAVIAGSVYLFLPVMIASLTGVMEHIDDELLEAAESLGASQSSAFFKVAVPLCIPGLLVGSVMVFTGTASAYTTPQLLGGNKNMVMVTLIYQQAITLGNWGNASAIAALMAAMSAGIIALMNRLALPFNRKGV
ncbi:MAG: ABC transporter permease [Spirochaetaceae bacterium]|jgi:putative spermidine/putrescine transport system permease protein|nr:ABC transporter permease [Spirochaetaceae bacterium]